MKLTSKFLIVSFCLLTFAFGFSQNANATSPVISICCGTINGSPWSAPGCGNLLSGQVLDNVNFTITAQSGTPSDVISITANFFPSLPFGSVFILGPAVGTNPVSRNLDFTISNTAPYTGQLIILAADQNGNSSPTCFMDVDFALPVELSSFVSIVNNNNVTLNWATSTETNNARFEIERTNVNSTDWRSVGTVAGNGTINTPVSYSFTDRGLSLGSFSYRLKQIDFNGNFEYHNLSNEVVIGTPNEFKLSQNYPNPFNPVTKIDFEIPKDGNVNLYVYDNTGKLVSSIVNEFRTAGYYSEVFNASNISSGIYYYKIEVNGSESFNKVMKMVLIK